MAIEKAFDIEFIAGMALREKQIQQNYRPIIAVHKWFARRPGTLFRGILLSEFAEGDLRDNYYRCHNYAGLKVADPFMGGGTPLLEANRIGCDVIGLDVNPMANWVVREEIQHLDLESYAAAAETLVQTLRDKVGSFYRTRCLRTGKSVDVKYFLWVKQGECIACDRQFDLFQGYLLAKDVRHPAYVVVCSRCGDLNEVDDPAASNNCLGCHNLLVIKGNVTRNAAACTHCGVINKAPFRREGPPLHRLFAIEYYGGGRSTSRGRLFKKPDEEDLARAQMVESLWQECQSHYVPDDVISAGDETNRLHRWGYKRWREMFNARQLLGLELSAREIKGINDPRVQRALATNLSDLLRYQNMACRYDTMALKSLDIFSVHGFPVGYVQCESNLLGILSPEGTPVGSGGWANIIAKYAKAKRYCEHPFEIEQRGNRKITVPIKGEWIGESRAGEMDRVVELYCESATEHEFLENSLDAVLTDPPYFGMVQYGELMEFCYVWLRKLMGLDFSGMERASAKHHLELTGNETANRDLTHFTEGLSAAYSRAAKALKPGGPLVFTYHHNKIQAYAAVVVAILDAGLTCSASIPCPAEMGGSIHIHGTGSSIVDTVFVCRKHGAVPRSTLFDSAENLADIVRDELAELSAAGMKPSDGDIRCIVYGHLARMAIWNLRSGWDATVPTAHKLSLAQVEMERTAQLDAVRQHLAAAPSRFARAGDLFHERAKMELSDANAF